MREESEIVVVFEDLLDGRQAAGKSWTNTGTDREEKIGYYNFTFEITAPAEMIEVGFLGGFGKECTYYWVVEQPRY